MAGREPLTPPTEKTKVLSEDIQFDIDDLNNEIVRLEALGFKHSEEWLAEDSVGRYYFKCCRKVSLTLIIDLVKALESTSNASLEGLRAKVGEILSGAEIVAIGAKEDVTVSISLPKSEWLRFKALFEPKAAEAKEEAEK
jgi:hypothetical protein